MSVVTVQLGQCGNQIGSQFFSTIANDLCCSQNSRVFGDYEDACVERFFSVGENGKKTARAVMVDTEPKVFLCLQDNSPTNQLAIKQVADWITCGLVNSPTANF